MATLPNTPGVIAVDHRFTIGGDTNVNSKLHFRYTGGAPTQQNLTDLASAIDALYNTNLKPWAGNDLVLDEIWCRNLADMGEALGVWSGSTAGTRGVIRNLPASICTVAGYRIARPYRGGHPRGYWPLGTANDAVAGNISQWTGTYVTSVEAALGAYVAGIQAITAPIAMGVQCSVSYYNGVTQYTKPNGQFAYRPTVRATPVVDNVTGINVAARFGSQRRRLKKA